jgi:acyl carrier protein
MSEKTLAEIQDKLKEIIVSVVDFELDKNTIDSGENGIHNLGLNSLAMIKMLVEVEKEFDVELDLEEADPEVWSSISNLAAYITASTGMPHP